MNALVGDLHLRRASTIGRIDYHNPVARLLAPGKCVNEHCRGRAASRWNAVLSVQCFFKWLSVWGYVRNQVLRVQHLPIFYYFIGFPPFRASASPPRSPTMRAPHHKALQTNIKQLEQAVNFLPRFDSPVAPLSREDGIRRRAHKLDAPVPICYRFFDNVSLSSVNITRKRASERASRWGPLTTGFAADARLKHPRSFISLKSTQLARRINRCSLYFPSYQFISQSALREYW